MMNTAMDIDDWREERDILMYVLTFNLNCDYCG